MKTDWLIVGAGFTGAVLAERIASQLGSKVTLIDKRPHIGGNAHDFINDSGILTHLYGPHIFHTNSSKVRDYLSRFTAWRPYEHRVAAIVDGKNVPLPFNLTSIETVFPTQQAARLIDLLTAHYGDGASIPILKLREEASGDLAMLADYIYKNIFHNYTIKQWGLAPDELDAMVTARVPVHVSRDNRYFRDTFQAMPLNGYTKMFAKILDHPKISLQLGTNYTEAVKTIEYDRMIFTGPIDAFFNYEFGALPYRSLRFDFHTLDKERHQETGTVNYPNDFDYTRVTEMKHLSGQLGLPKTTLVYECPQAYEPGKNNAYYPIPCATSRDILRPYEAKAAALKGKVFFAGRLGDYKYYNMDHAVARALALFDKEIVRADGDLGGI
jgi:UDP-galactopyranose mutase